jgi:hypothetical protein
MRTKVVDRKVLHRLVEELAGIRADLEELVESLRGAQA